MKSKLFFSIIIVLFPVLMQAQSWNQLGQVIVPENYTHSVGLVIEGTTPYIALQTNSSYVIERYTGGSWEIIGTFPTNIHDFSFDVWEGVVYCAFNNSNYEISTMSNESGNWEYLDEPGFIKGQNMDISIGGLARPGTIEPFIAFADGNNLEKLSVMWFDGGNWEAVGGSGISAGMVNNNTLDIEVSDQAIYVLYSDVDYNNKATLMKYYDYTWSIVGEAGFSDWVLDTYQALAVWNNTPYVFATKLPYGHGLVYEYSNESWEIVGSNEGIGFQSPQFKSLVCSQEGILYIAYADPALYPNNLVVKKYINNDWENVGTDVSDGQSKSILIDIDTQGKPYVFYTGQGKDLGPIVKVYGNSDGLEDIQNTSLISLSPNPANRIVKLKNNGNQRISHYSIYDQTGRKMFTNDIEILNGEEEEIDVSFLPNGVYIVEMQAENQNYKTKLIKFQ